MLEGLNQFPLNLKFCIIDFNDGLLTVNIPQYTDLEFLQVLKIWNITRELSTITGNKPACAIYVGEKVSISEGAFDFLMGENGSEYISHTAIVINSWKHKQLQNFVNKINERHYTKLFNSPNEANKWLQAQGVLISN